MPKQPKPTKKYADMTPEEQYQYRLTDNRGTYFNGQPVNMDEEEPEEDEPGDEAEDDSATVAKVKGRRGS